MVELNPMPRKPNLFVLIPVAVVSGAAALYCFQTIRLMPVPAALFAPAPAPGESKEPPAPLPAEPPPAAPDPSIESARFQAAPPPAQSMLVVPEPGGADAGIVSVGETPADSGPAAPAKAPESAPAPARKPMPGVHLRQSTLTSRYVGTVGHGFESARLAPPSFAQKEAPQEAAPAPAAAPRARLIGGPRILNEKPLTPKDIFVPSLLHPETPPERPFWDRERKQKAALAGLIAVSGAIYLLLALGYLNSLVGRPRDGDGRKPA